MICSSLPYSRCYLRFQSVDRMNEFVTKLDRSTVPGSESRCGSWRLFLGKISVMIASYQKWEYISNKSTLNTIETDPDYLDFLKKESVVYAFCSEQIGEVRGQW